MLRLVQIGNSLPYSWPVDPKANFQPGQIAQLFVSGNQIICGVSDGTAPIGIIDDIKTNSFFSAAIDEIVTVPAIGVVSSGILVTPVDIKTELANAYLSDKSFVANIDVELNARNGVITIPAGSALNFDSTGSGTPDSVRVVVSYTYQIPNVLGDDSTMGSGRVTVWFQKMLFETDQFETNQRYPVGANLFVSEDGLLTTRQPTVNHPAIAILTAPPTSMYGNIQALWL